MEREIVEPIEEAFSSISGVDWSKTQASSTDGLAQFTVFFDFEKDIQQASQDIRDAISTKRADLPTEMEEPILTRFDPSQQSVVSLALTSSTVSTAVLTRIADPMIVRDLRTVPGVAQVTVVGGLERELTVQLRPADLQAAGVSVAEVVQALESQNLAAPVGRLNGALDERAIRLKGRLDTPEDFEQLVVAERNGEVIRLGQVADALDGTEEQRDLALFNGREAVGIEILKAKGYSTTQVTDVIHRHVGGAAAADAAGGQAGDRAGRRRPGAPRRPQRAGGADRGRAAHRAGGVPLPQLLALDGDHRPGAAGERAGLVHRGLGLRLHPQHDVAARPLARHRHPDRRRHRGAREHRPPHRDGEGPLRRRAREGTDEIGLAVAATTFSIVAVFVPVAFMYGVAGQWFKPFALTIACAVLVSLFVSFSLDPMLSAYWADPQTEAHERRNPIARTLDRFNRWFDRHGRSLQGRHRLGARPPARDGAAGRRHVHRRDRDGRRRASSARGFVPVSDRSEISMIVETPPGSNLEYTRLKAEEVARLARAHPEVRYTYTTVGTPRAAQDAVGGPGAHLRAAGAQGRPRRSARTRWAQILRDEMERIGGAQVSVFTSGFGGAFKQIQLQMRGRRRADAHRAGAARRGRGGARCRARWTSASPPAARSRSSRWS